MQSLNPTIATVLLLTVSAVLCGAPQLAQAQQSSQSPPAHTSEQNVPPVDTPANRQQPPSPTGTSADPSQGPLEPLPPSPESQEQQLPNFPSATQSQTTGTPQAPPVPMANAPAPQKPPSEPVGTATAERTPTAGGAASEPAGTAIAPAKQRQVRSLLIKLGAVAGAGVALGTVMALSKGTPSTPPGATRSITGR
jgi:hypothetical protein